MYIYSVIWSHVTWLADLSLPARCFVFRNVEERETLVNKTEEWRVEPRNVYETRLDLFLISYCKSKYARETSWEAILFCLNYHLWLLHRCSSCRTHLYALLLNLTESEVQTASKVSGLRTMYSWNKWVSSKFCGKPYVFCFSFHSLLFFSTPAREKNVIVFFCLESFAASDRGSINFHLVMNCSA